MIRYLPLLLTLTACGGVPIDQPPDEVTPVVIAPPNTGTCMTYAVRSQSGSTTTHSTDGGNTWLPGGCGAP